MSSSNCCFLTCIQISQEADQVVWYSHLLQNFPQFIVTHTVKGFGIVSKAEVDVFLELSSFLWSSGPCECRRGSTNHPNSFHCRSLAKAFSCWWGQSQGSIWHHSGWSWRRWGTSWHRSRGHGASVIYAHSTSHSHLTHPYLLLPRIREGSLESFLLPTIVWPQVNNRKWTQPHSSTENWIKDVLSLALPFRTRPSFPLSQSLPSGSFHKPLILLHQRADRLKISIIVSFKWG